MTCPERQQRIAGLRAAVRVALRLGLRETACRRAYELWMLWEVICPDLSCSCVEVNKRRVLVRPDGERLRLIHASDLTLRLAFLDCPLCAEGVTLLAPPELVDLFIADHATCRRNREAWSA